MQDLRRESQGTRWNWSPPRQHPTLSCSSECWDSRDSADFGPSGPLEPSISGLPSMYLKPSSNGKAWLSQASQSLENYYFPSKPMRPPRFTRVLHLLPFFFFFSAPRFIVYAPHPVLHAELSLSIRRYNHARRTPASPG